MVSRYLTNKLIHIWAHLMARGEGPPSLVLRRYAVVATVSSSYPLHQAVSRHYSPVRHSSAKQQAASCYRSTLHVLDTAASVQSEP